MEPADLFLCPCFAEWQSLRTPFCAPTDLFSTLLCALGNDFHGLCRLNSCCLALVGFGQWGMSRAWESQLPQLVCAASTALYFVSRSQLFRGPLCQPATVTDLAGSGNPLFVPLGLEAIMAS